MLAFRFTTAPAYQPHAVALREPMPDEAEAILRVADALAPELREAFMAAVDALRGSARAADLEVALASGSVDVLEDLLDFVGFDAALTDAIGTAAFEAATTFADVRGTFDLLNPEAVNFARARAAEQVSGITENTRLALRQIVTDAVEQGTDVRTLARRVRSHLGLTPQQAGAVERYRATLVKNGTAPGRAERMASIQADRFLDARATTIARTESIRAANAGQQLLYDGYQRKGILPRWALKEWITAKDERTCPVCRPMDGQQVLVKDGEFQGAGLARVSHPPIHSCCRCAFALVPGETLLPPQQPVTGELTEEEEYARVKAYAQEKIAAAPVPSEKDVIKARADLANAARAGGDSRGGSAAARRKQRENLWKEFGGPQRGYVPCPHCGVKMGLDRNGPLETFERGKIFTKKQGGGYQLPNLLPECFACNRSRNDTPIRFENLV